MKKNYQFETAQKYAQAWFNACESAKIATAAFQDAQKLDHAFNTQDISILSNPAFEEKALSETIEQIGRQLKLAPVTLQFLLLLAQNRRLQLLPLALKSFTHIYYQAQNILEVFVESAYPLSTAQKHKLEAGLEKGLKRSVVASYALNPSVLGGVSVQYDGVLSDDTLKNKLNRLKKLMKGHE